VDESPAPGTEDSIVNPPTDDQGNPAAGGGQPAQGSDQRQGGSGDSAGERIQMIIAAAEQAAAGIIEDADAQARRYIDASRQRADALADERVRVMSDLTETLVRQAELVRRQSDELLSALDSARSELAGRIGQELTQGPQAAPGPQALQSQAGDQPAAAPPQAAPAEAPPQGAPAQAQPQGPPPQQGGNRVPHLQPVESDRPDLQAVESPPEPEQPSGQPASQPPPAPPPPSPIKPSVPPASGAAVSDGARLLAAQMAVAGSSREEIANRLRDEFGIQDAGPILDGILGSG
jgi:hypothetical protein